MKKVKQIKGGKALNTAQQRAIKGGIQSCVNGDPCPPGMFCYFGEVCLPKRF